MKRRVFLTLPLLAACQTVDAQQTTTVVGVVETVDPGSREVLLRGQSGAQSGGLLSFIAGRAVQRLDRIRPGDRVTVRYYQAIAAQAVNPLSPTSQPFAGAMIQREAERPGGEVTRVRSGRVTITAVDPATNTVSFIGPANIPRTATARNPQVQAFVRSLRVGQEVDMVYEEALAIAIDPMP